MKCLNIFVGKVRKWVYGKRQCFSLRCIKKAIFLITAFVQGRALRKYEGMRTCLFCFFDLFSPQNSDK